MSSGHSSTGRRNRCASPFATRLIAISLLDRLMAGRKPNRRRRATVFDTEPYSKPPARTQSCACFGKMQHGGGVRERMRQRRGQPAAKRAIWRASRRRRFIRTREVRHQHDVRIDVRQGAQAPAGRRVGPDQSRGDACRYRSSTRALSGRGSRSAAITRSDGVVHHDVQIEPVHFEQVARLHRCPTTPRCDADAGGTQALAVGDAGHAEGIGACRACVRPVQAHARSHRP
jgi:hypothetical protein